VPHFLLQPPFRHKVLFFTVNDPPSGTGFFADFLLTSQYPRPLAPFIFRPPPLIFPTALPFFFLFPVLSSFLSSLDSRGIGFGPLSRFPPPLFKRPGFSPVLFAEECSCAVFALGLFLLNFDSSKGSPRSFGTIRSPLTNLSLACRLGEPLWIVQCSAGR